MKVSIVVPDSKVYVEGEPCDMNMNDMPDYAQAVQWYGSYGEIEFKPDSNGRRLPNLRFTDFTPFEFMVDRWRQRKKYLEDQAKLMKEEEDARKAELKTVDDKVRSERPM